MNATSPISQAPSGSDAAQLNGPGPAASPPAGGANQDFARALSDAGGKPARKSAVSKEHGATSSGSTLPVPGNQPPPVPASPPALTALGSPPAVKTDLLAAAQAADAAGASAGPPAGAAAANPSAIPAAPTLPANAGSTAALAPNFDLAGALVSAPGGVAPASAGSANAPGGAANGPAVPGSGVSVPQSPGIQTLTSVATSKGSPAAPQGSAPGAKSGDGIPSQGAIAPASQTSSNAVNDPAFSGPAAAAPAQAVMAAVIAQGTSAPSVDTTLQGVASTKDVSAKDASANGTTAGAPAAALAQASAATSAAVTAATAGRIAQEVSSAAAAGAADKRSHTTSPDLSLSAASNDGSAGAAQLLTSNTPTDGSPAPTFKIAAGVDTPGFGQGVADKVSVMMDGNLTSAKLQVNPPALGPIEVRIALQGGHAQVWLSSHSAVTRDALESSSPKLREMLGSQGFSQVSVDISHRSFQDRSPPSRAYEAMPSIEGVAPVAPASTAISRSAIGLLDAYA